MPRSRKRRALRPVPAMSANAVRATARLLRSTHGAAEPPTLG